jgi:hypothetical protein
MAIETSLTKKMISFENSEDCFLALLGKDGEFDPTFLNVKYRLGDVPLCKDNVILLIFGYRVSIAHFCKKFLGIKRDPSSLALFFKTTLLILAHKVISAHNA